MFFFVCFCCFIIIKVSDTVMRGSKRRGRNIRFQISVRTMNFNLKQNEKDKDMFKATQIHIK